MPLYDGATKKSLFVQTRTLSRSKLMEGVNHVLNYHRDPNKDDYIFNFVMNEIGTPGGLVTDRLDAIAQHLPGGGGRQAFDNVFIGSHAPEWQGPGNNYRDGILNADFRWENLRLQKQLWQQYKARYPQIQFHFYIEYEAALDMWDEAPIRQAYEAYLIQSVRDAHSIWPDRAIMWSPAIWVNRGLSWSEEYHIREVFKRVRWYAQQAGHYGGITWLHLQDMMGRGWAGVEPELVKQWYNELAAAYKFDSLRINMEMFREKDGVYRPMTNAEIREVENWYERNGVPLGASWELRWWLPNHTEL